MSGMAAPATSRGSAGRAGCRRCGTSRSPRASRRAGRASPAAGRAARSAPRSCPAVRNWAKPPSPFGIPSAAYRACTSPRETSTSRCSTCSTPRFDATASTASLTSRSAGLNRSGISLRAYVTLETGRSRLVGSRRGPSCASLSSPTSTATGTRFEAVLADIAQRGRRRDLVPRRHRRLRPAAEPLRRRGARRARRSACSATTTSRRSARSTSPTSRPTPPTSARWTIDELEPDDARVPEDARAEGRARRRRALPREPARPGLGVRAQRVGGAHGARADDARARARRPQPHPDRAPALERRRARGRAREGRQRDRARPRAAGCSTRARSASRATATRALRTC